ncbi:MAG: HDOD domain-containing protein [Gammaproteobacteria bacterium]|nr:MAG: HDOD domain-containing protein [Gammaproteobacteria bacterium]
MDRANEQHITKLINDIQNHKITLPSLPEVAVKVRKFVDDPDMGIAQLSKAISTDPALAARLLQVANSPFFRCMTPSSNLNNAISRLGGVCVRNIVTSLVMAQLYKTNISGAIKNYMKDLWEHSTAVAAYSNVIARKFTKLDAEEAMLTGLVHSIGALPILTSVSSNAELSEDFDTVVDLVTEFHTDIGKITLEEWGFPENMIFAVAEHEDLDRKHEGEADLTDVVTVSSLHATLGKKNVPQTRPWDEIPAFKALNLTPEQSIDAMIEAQDEIGAIQKLLRM